MLAFKSLVMMPLGIIFCFKMLNILLNDHYMGNRIIATHDWPYLTNSQRISTQIIHIQTRKQLESALGPVLTDRRFNRPWLALVSPEMDRLLSTSAVITLDTHTHTHTWMHSCTHLPNPLPLCTYNTPSMPQNVSLQISSNSRSFGNEDILFDLHRNFPLSHP